MAPPPTLYELITVVHQDAPSQDPLDLLATASRTITELSTMSDAVLDHFVAGARREGRSWTDISGVLGVSKQAAHKRYSITTQGLDRFTARARNTVEASRTVALGLGHTFIGTEHLLLAQFTEPRSVASLILARHHIDQAAVQEKVLALIPGGAPLADTETAAFTPRAAGALSAAVGEALKLGHNYIGTEHLLLALFEDTESVAFRILDGFDLDADGVRSEVVEVLGQVLSTGPLAQPEPQPGSDAPPGA
jgi:hypothetical protein